MANQQQNVNPAQANAIARNMVIANSVERIQQIYSSTVSFASLNGGPITISPRNVGLIKGFFVDVAVDVTNNDAAAVTLQLTDFGAANVLSQIKFDDLQNNTRIQTTGWHVHFVNSARNQRPWGLVTAGTDDPGVGYASNFSNVISAPDSIEAGQSATIYMRYYVPLAYSNEDLRGSIYANVVNATMQLGLTVNPNMVVQGAAAAIAPYFNTAVYRGATPSAVASIGNVTVTVYQHYLDQIPMSGNGPVLPMLDLQTIYELKNTTMTGISVNQDYTIPYANFRTFLSTFAIFDNAETSTGGVDVNYWALRSANFTDIFKIDPEESALLSRLRIGTDWPGPDSYYFDHRNKPINTLQYGNMELVLNAAALNANSPARVFVGYEDFAMINVVSGAGSLPAGG